MNTIKIDENKLDELLRDLYLEEQSAIPNEEEAIYVLKQEYPVKIDSTREKELIARLSKKNKFLWLKWLLVVLLTFIALIFLYFYFKDKKDSQQNTINNEVIAFSSQKGNDSIVSLQETQTPVVNYKDTFGRPKTVNTILLDSILTEEVKGNIMQEPSIEKTVPFISEGDKLKYRKVKEQIIQRLLSRNKDLYTFIPAAKVEYKNSELILDAFTLRNVGITNLEYKTFLADLLAQGRNQEYLIANINSNGWLANNYPQLALQYFNNEKYNDFPVVNVTNEGASLFCAWLQDEIVKYEKKNNIKSNNLQIRLPLAEEWIYAAREGYAKIAFDKGYNTIYDEREGLVNKTFTKRVELVKKRVKRIDTLYTQYTTNRYGWKEDEILNFIAKGFSFYSPSPSDTIHTARMKVFGKLGRVSEIVYQKNSKKIWLCGLNWANIESYQKLESEFVNNESSPFVGFRIIVVNPNDPEYKNPFW